MNQLIMLGTGHAMVTKCYNTCFLIRNDLGSHMVDAGGGNGILRQMELANVGWKELKSIFFTHSHSDHVIGGIWVIRKINTMMKNGEYQGVFHVYGLAEIIDFLKYTCSVLIHSKMDQRIEFITIDDNSSFIELGIHFEVFDIHSTKKRQLGFKANMNGPKLVCLGDEPFHIECAEHLQDVDWLLHEAFCLYEDKDIYLPYEKHHSTALDAGRNAEKYGVKNLVLYHTEDDTLSLRKERYENEARQVYHGKIFVPDDLDIIILDK